MYLAKYAFGKCCFANKLDIQYCPDINVNGVVLRLKKRPTLPST